MAVLCIALVAIVTLDHTRSAHAAANTPYNIAIAVAAHDGQGGQRDVPAPRQSEQQSCAMHDGVAPSAQDAGFVIQAAVRLSVPLTSDTAPEGMSVRLDRPPKATAIV